MNEQLHLLRASTRQCATICQAIASGAPAFYLSLAMAAEGLVSTGFTSPGFDQLTEKMAKALLVLGDSRAPLSMYRKLKLFSTFLLLSTMVGTAFVSETGPKFQEKADSKRAKWFTIDLMMRYLISSGFLMGQIKQLVETAGFAKKKKESATHLLHAVVLLFALHMIAEGDRDFILRLFDTIQEELAKSLESIKKAIAGVDAASCFRAPLQQLSMALQKGEHDEFLNLLTALLLQTGISIDALTKELLITRRHLDFYRACLTSGLEEQSSLLTRVTQA